MFLGTTIDTDWTNLPARPSYLPFVQQFATYLSEKALPPQVLVNAGLPLAYCTHRKRKLNWNMNSRRPKELTKN